MRQNLKRTLATSAFLAAICLTGGVALAQGDGQAAGAGNEAAAGGAPGQQQPGAATGGAASVEPLVTFTTFLTARSHAIAAGGTQGNLEGTACGAAPRKMISGACHPFYNDRVTIINQFPNIGANTWRCGFRNNTAAAVTVWIYTVCAQ
jgi:hypothetical protein